MKPLLYLDTARFGLMAPRVKHAIDSLNRFASTEGLSGHFDDLIFRGFKAWPASLRHRYSGLADWEGIPELKASLQKRVGFSSDRPVFLAMRSTNLMKIAARLLFQRCRNVLVTDLEWPGYVGILKQESHRARGHVLEVRVQTPVLQGDVSAEDLCRIVANKYRSQRADGLFLSVVSHHGVCLPVAAIMRELEDGPRPPKFIVLDDTQAIGHIPHEFELGNCDLLLAGCHKWMRSHHPLAFAVSIRRRSHELIRLEMQNMAGTWDADDPLLSFSMQSEAGNKNCFSETLDLTGVFCGRAAVAQNTAETEANQFIALTENRHVLEEVAEGTAWQPLLPHPSLRSGIMLFQAKDSKTKKLPPAAVRAKFLARGVALSSYDNGLVRVSLPQTQLSPADRDRFSAALTE